MSITTKIYERISAEYLLERIILLLLGVAVFSRVYFYFNYNALWHDAACLANSILTMDLIKLSTEKLLYDQSAPLGFMVFTKLIVGDQMNTLRFYLIPLISGLLLIYTSYKLVRENFKEVHVIFYFILFIQCYALLYYTTEFKQYILESYISILLLYTYIKNIKNIHGKIQPNVFFIFFISFFFSSTSIFILFGIAVSILINLKNLEKIKNYLFINKIAIFTLSASFAVYYITYLSNSGTVNSMQSYWALSFIPTDFENIPTWYSNVFLPVVTEFIPTSKSPYVFLLLFPLGMYVLLKNNKNIFFVIFFSAIGICIASLMKYYPLGHGGYRGARFMLFYIPLAFIPVSCACVFMAEKILRHKKLIIVAACILSIIAAYSNLRYIYRGNKAQETAHLIEILQENYQATSQFILFKHAIPSYNIYNKNKPLNYTILDRDKNILSQMMLFTQQAVQLQKNELIILLSHYDQKVLDKIIEFCQQNAFSYTTVKDVGAVLLFIQLEENVLTRTIEEQKRNF